MEMASGQEVSFFMEVSSIEFVFQGQGGPGARRRARDTSVELDMNALYEFLDST